MTEADALEIVWAATWTIIIVSGPAILAGMLIGIVIALLQALTQVQEMTLTFIPKIVIIIGIIIVMGPFIGAQMLAFSEQVYAHIETGFVR